MAKATFSVKNFAEFQHYKDRNPIWIKLYNRLLDDYDFGLLPDASKGHLLAIWLLASRHDNVLPLDPTWVAGRINANTTVDLNILRDSGFLVFNQDDTDALAGRYQSAIPEKRRDTSKNREDISSLRSDIPAKRSKRSLPSDFPLEADLAWATECWLKRGRSDLCDLISEEAAKFRDHHTAKDTRSADWAASWRTWAQNALRFNNGGHSGRSETGQRTARDKRMAGILAARNSLRAKPS